MLNLKEEEPLTSAELFLLMRLLQHLEDEEQLPEKDDHDWQNIYSKLNHLCLKVRDREGVTP